MLSIIITLVLVILLLFIYELLYKRKLKACARRLPGFPMIPFLGNAHQLKPTPRGRILAKIFANIPPEDVVIQRNLGRGFLDFLIKTSEYSKVSRFMLGPILFVVITDPADIELVTTDVRLINKSPEYDLYRDWLGEGLIISGGNKWKTRRKLLTPSFHFNILKQYIPIFEQNADILVKQFGEKPEEVIDVHPLIALCSLDIILETAMGVQLNAQLGCHEDYVNAVANIKTIILRRSMGLMIRFDLFFKLMPVYNEYKKQLKILYAMTSSVIKEKMGSSLQKGLTMDKNISVSPDDYNGVKKRHTFLHTLLNCESINGKLSDEDVQEEVGTFMFAGHDTITSALSFLLYNMAMNPEIQKKVYQEQISIFSGDAKKKMTLDDLNKMKYMEMVIKESLRLYTTVPMVLRQAPFDFDMNGIKIPAGCSILLNIFSMNRNPEVFPDPLKFIPERFSPEEISKRHPFSNITFSAGPRNCIGQRFAMIEIKCIFSKCIRRLEFLPGDRELELGTDIVLYSCNGIHLRTRKRYQ